MDTIALFIGLALFSASIVYVSLPFRKRRVNTNSYKVSLQPTAQRETVLAALRDLDFDFKTGKVSEEDYQPLRTELMVEAAQYIKEEQTEDAQLEGLIRARRTMQHLDLKCQHCGAPIEAEQRFCSNCGYAVNNEQCPSCGKKIQSGDLFCSSCGDKIESHIQALAQS